MRQPSPAAGGQPVGGPIPVVELHETDSTNSEAMRRAMAGQSLPFWIVSDRQTGGRGRSGRVWQSQPGNLHASLAIAVCCDPARLGQLSLVAGLAVAETVRDLASAAGVAPDTVALKWPNDVLIRHRPVGSDQPGWAKAGGILTESAALPLAASSGDGESWRLSVIGIGLNLVDSPEIEGRAATSLHAAGIAAERGAALSGISARLDPLLALWDGGRGFPGIQGRWLKVALPTGEPMTVHAGGALARGRFAGLDGDGALLIEDEARVQRRFTFGDVTLGDTPGP